MSDQEAMGAEEQVSDSIAEQAAEEAPQADEAPVADDDLEVVELELSDDDIVRYLEDDQGNRIGFVIMEDGEEAEYLYVEDDEDEGEDVGGEVVDDGSLGITRDGVQQATDDMNAIFKDGVKMAAEFKGAFDDIKSALDFSSLLK
ncbi:hypothetical protein [uncultured Senegalimassilia sp.]|uniref:hypothetical protein n=1 Tax=uncultured Senegalimassilia sp. TaxID=1714350 RepID=UPI0025F0D71A|nr:hypothetical protein [uncultured Senegalimassilia sp.]